MRTGGSGGGNDELPAVVGCPTGPAGAGGAIVGSGGATGAGAIVGQRAAATRQRRERVPRRFGAGATGAGTVGATGTGAPRAVPAGPDRPTSSNAENDIHSEA